MPRKYWWWIGLGAGAVVLVALIVTGIWRRSGGELPKQVENVIRQLPGGGGREQELETPEVSVPPSTPRAGRPAGEQPQAQQSLAVTLSYQIQPFTMTIDRVAQTFEVPTIDEFAPLAGEPFSVVKVRQAGEVVLETQLTVPTQYVFEQFSTDSAANPLVTTELNQLELDVVIPLPEGSAPDAISIETPGGETIDQAEFEYERLPTDAARQSRWLPGGEARAQAAGDVLTLVVTSQGGRGGAAAHAATEEMVRTIEPWKSYFERGLVQVAEEVRGGDMKCGAAAFGRSSLPNCPNAGRIIRFVNNAVNFHPKVIIVAVTGTNLCQNCGTAYYGRNIVATGNNPTADLVAHELAHALSSQLIDEYLYHWLWEGPARRPNCFQTEALCQQAIATVGGGCHLGCNSVTSWRTIGLGLMSATRPRQTDSYGPFDTCLVSRAIAGEIGLEETGFCHIRGEDNEAPETGTFWGWFKGG